MYQIVFYVPESHLEQVKSAVFDAGGGRIGDYDHCCWQVPGKGQFRPLAGSDPFIGQQGVVETVDEYRVEMVVDTTYKEAVVAALLSSHPYEEPAFLVLAVDNICQPK